MPKTSIVVPVYNVAAYLEKCVRSLLCQTEQDFELLLIDDGSTDESGKLCDVLAETDPRIRVIHQENRGLGGARNTGIEAAVGKYLLLIDSDDSVLPETLEKALDAAEREQAEIAVFGFFTEDEQGNRLADFPCGLTMRGFAPREQRDCLLTSPCAWNKLYKRELFVRTGIRYPSRVWYEDIRTTLKLFTQAERITGVDYLGYSYLQRAGSIMNSGNLQRNCEIIEAFDDLLSWFDAQKLTNEYKQELCWLCAYHVYFTASVRVLRAEKADKALARRLLAQFRAYTEEHFPNYKSSPYLARLSKSQRLLWQLLNRKQYGLIKLLFQLKK